MTCIYLYELHRVISIGCCCVCAAEAEDLSSRLQAGKQRVSELERTLSSVSTQHKQFEKVPDPLHYQLHLTKTTQFKFKKPFFCSIIKSLRGSETVCDWRSSGLGKTRQLFRQQVFYECVCYMNTVWCLSVM